MKLPFVKMHGLGNDYIFVDCTCRSTAQIIHNSDLYELSRRISNRHFGVGSDGLVLIMSGDNADFGMRIFNADGSEASMCGNAARCVGKYVYEHGLTHSNKITLETLSGVKEIGLHMSNDKIESVSVNMGTPVLKPESFVMDGRKIDFSYVDIGNPHAVIFTDKPVGTIDIARFGSALGDVFSDGINIEFVNKLSTNELCVRVLERGSGETMACGTGACACVAAGVSLGIVEPKTIVHLAGGALLVEWKAATGEIWQTGPAVEVCQGIIEY